MIFSLADKVHSKKFRGETQLNILPYSSVDILFGTNNYRSEKGWRVNSKCK